MAKSNIEWTERTWNPITGCTKVSQGCKNCYAEKMFKRLVAMGSDDYVGREFTDVKFHSSRLSYPASLKKPAMIFVNSMSDLFHEKISFDEIRNIWDVMVTNPQHTYQILTKRPERLLDYCKYESERIAAEGYEKINGWAFHIPDIIWLGVSVENQATADERIPILLQTPAAVRWLSVEPMLEGIDLSKYIDKLDWIVVGCESGHNRRECKIEWIESIVDQCKEANVPVFVKQIQINGKVVKDINQFPEYLRIREYPLKKN
jgi:protein gp37